MSGMPEVMCLWEYDMMIGKGELHILFVDGENISKSWSL